MKIRNGIALVTIVLLATACSEEEVIEPDIQLGAANPVEQLKPNASGGPMELGTAISANIWTQVLTPNNNTVVE